MFGASLVLPLAVATVLVPFRVSFPNTDSALLLVVTVVGVASLGRRVAGLFAAASAAIWFDFFLTAPYEHFTITRRADIETTLLLLVVGAAVTELAVRGRRFRISAEIGRRYLAAIDSAAGTPDSPAFPSVISERLVDVLDLRSAHFERNRFGGMPRLEADGHISFKGRDFATPAEGALPGPLELLAQSNGHTYGRFVLDPSPGVVVSSEARRVATILASQAAPALG